MQSLLDVVQSSLDSAATCLSTINSRITGRRLLFAFASASAAAWLLRRWLRDRRLPPGPWGVPLIGCLQLRDQSQWHIRLSEMAPQFPGIFSFRAGCKLVIVVTSYQLVKEMLDRSEFTGREFLMQKISKHCGLIFNEGEVWLQHRRTGLRVLRDFGFARPQSAEMVETAMTRLFVELDSASDQQKEVQVMELFQGVSNSVIAQLLFGRVFSTEEPDFAEFCENVKASVLGEQLTIFSQYWAIGQHVLRLPLPQEIKNRSDRLRAYVRKVIDQRRDLIGEDETEAHCLCDAYIIEARRLQQLRQQGVAIDELAADIFSANQMLQVCLEFFIAGTDTTARTVEWAMLHLALNPKSQQLLHKELDEVVGSSRAVRLSDRTQLHYLCAVIDECYRVGSIVAIGLFHRALQDTEFHGFLIPHDAVILPHVYAVHHDPQLWQQPHEFRPQRFLDSNGRYISNQHLIPFLIGKRACIGESLARMEVFLMISLIMQRYEVKPTEDTSRRRQEILRGKSGFLYEPASYALVFRKRISCDL